MLRNNSSIRWTSASMLGSLTILIAIAIPGIVQATSITSTLSDLSTGVSVTATFDDGITLGSVDIALSIVSNPGGVSLTGFYLRIMDDAFPALVVTGADVFNQGYYGSSSGMSPCPCYSITELGNSGVVDPTGITSTTLNLAHISVPLSLNDLGGSLFVVVVDVPGAEEAPFLKLRGELPVIPEPTTGALMLFGLMGLAGSSRRLALPQD